MGRVSILDLAKFTNGITVLTTVLLLAQCRCTYSHLAVGLSRVELSCWEAGDAKRTLPGQSGP